MVDASRSIEIDVILFCGQSNMAAFGADFAEVRRDVCDAVTPYWWSIQGRPSVAANTSRGHWQELQPLDWPLAEAPGGIKHGRFGPEMGFVRSLRSRHSDGRFAVVKVQIGGSCLADWFPGAAFDPSGFARIQAEVPRALDSLREQGCRPRLAGLIWFQGEGDSGGEREAETYGVRFLEMFSSIRHVLGAGDLPCVLIQTHFPIQPFNEAVQMAQVELAARMPATRLVETKDLNQVDGVHFDSQAILEIGRRAALAWESLTHRS